MSSGFLRQFEKVKPADIEWRTYEYPECGVKEDIPFSREFDDIYFNPVDGLAESEYVFLKGNNLPEDWLGKNSNLTHSQNQQRFSVAELGFGSGLNFLMTLDKWLETISHRTDKDACYLNFISIEKRPFTPQDFQKAAKHWPQFSELAEHLYNNYPSLTYGRHQIHFEKWQATLTLFLMPVEDALEDLYLESKYQEHKTEIDHWFFDGFAPAKNESMWGESICKQVSKLSNPRTRLATFSVSAAVKNPLKAAGFELKKLKGFGRKREMLTACLTEKQEEKESKFINLKHDSPWLNICKSKLDKKVAIIGAGIAGCATALELSRAGYHVHIFDSEDSIASKASGAAAGIFHPQLTADMNFNSQFHWLSYLYLLRFLNTLSQNEKEKVILSHGINRLLPDKKAKQQLISLTKAIGIESWIEEPVEIKNERGVYFPDAAAIDIPEFCELLINRIPENQKTLSLSTSVDSIEKTDEGWQINSSPDEFDFSHSYFSHIVICGGAQSELTDQFLQSETNTSRGQTCLFESEKISHSFNQVICEQSYLVPRPNNMLHLGTTFETSDEPHLKRESQLEMLEKASNMFNDLGFEFLSEAEQEALPLAGTLGFRRHALDRLPIIGATIDSEKIKKEFEGLGQKRIERQSLTHYNKQGLWLNTAYGSHGLLVALISARHLSSLISNDISPINSSIAATISPSRFIVKSLKA